MGGDDNWGPWAIGIDSGERLARVRTLRTIMLCRYQSGHPLARALARAESLDPADLEEARIELDRMPALDRRQVLRKYLTVVTQERAA